MVHDARTCIIVSNPASARRRSQPMVEAVAARLQSGFDRVTLWHTEKRGDAARLTEQLLVDSGEWPRLIVAAGGDGTVQEIAQALARAKAAGVDPCPALGIIPAGRCNDFARALGISKDPSAVAETLLRGRCRTIDLGRVNGRYFCTIATVGIDAKITGFVDQMRIPLRGTPAYLYGTFRVLLRYAALPFRLDGDIGELQKDLFVASVANTTYYGGAIPLVPHADPTDGLLDLCMIDRIPRRRILTLLPRILMGKHCNRPEVSFARTRQLRIETPRPCEIWADGEHIATTPAVIDLVPGAIRVVC